MTVFYRGSRIVITHRDFRILRPYPRVFPIRELRHVHVVMLTPSMVPGVIGSSGMAGVAAVIVATGGLELPVPLVVVGGISLIASAALAGACIRVASRRYELRALHRGKPVLLLGTTDGRTFGQVKRGLLRAIQQIADV